MIRPATIDDAAAVAAIYNHYILKTIVSFEEEAVTADAMAERIKEVIESYPWLVLEEPEGILGYAYARRWQVRCAYRFAVESTVYLRQDVTGRGHGTALYTRLLDDLRSRKLHCVVGGIALPNAGSVRLHEKLGFRKVAHFEQVGRKFDQWIDVGYWELVLPQAG